MCKDVQKRVVSYSKNIATMEDGSIVKTNLIGRVKPGDILEVYGDIALSNASSGHGNTIEKPYFDQIKEEV